MPTPGPLGRIRPVLLAAAPGALALLVHAWSYLPFIADDALISLRYARRLLDGKGLTWDDYERVEGYSNLLYVLACAALGALGLDLIDAARIVGVTGGLLAVGAVALRGVRTAPSRFAAALPPVFVGLAGPIAAWAIGGLEQALVAGLLAAAFVATDPLLEPTGALSRRAPWLAGAFLAAACWARPDGPLFTALVVAGLLVIRRDRAALAHGAALAVLPVLATLLQLAGRLAYYGDWVPNTAHAKLAFTGARLLLGATYVVEGLVALGPLVLAAAVSLVALRDPARRRRIALAGIVLAGWLAYVVSIGGDIFPAWRHLAPAVPCLALLVAEGVGYAAERLARSARGLRRFGAAALAITALYGWQQAIQPENDRARHERWEWEGEHIGHLLHTAFGAQAPLVGVLAAGTVPYFSGLPSLDLLGLNDRWIATHPPPGFGTGRLGHELGDPAYVHDRAPDLIIFGSARGMQTAGGPLGRGILQDPRFGANYRVVQFRARGSDAVRSWIWARATSPRIGVRREAGVVTVPGFLFATDPAHPASLDATQALGVRLDTVPVAWEGLDVGVGAWIVEVEASGAPVSVAIGGEARPPPFRVTLGAPVDVRLSASGPAHLRAVRFVAAPAE